MTRQQPSGDNGRIAYSVQETARMLGVCDKGSVINKGIKWQLRARFDNIVPFPMELVGS